MDLSELIKDYFGPDVMFQILSVWSIENAEGLSVRWECITNIYV